MIFLFYAERIPFLMISRRVSYETNSKNQEERIHAKKSEMLENFTLTK